MRIARTYTLRVRQRKRPKQPDRLGLRLVPRQSAVDQRAFNHLIHDALGRIEGRRRALCNICHSAPAQLCQFGIRQFEHIHIADAYRAAYDAAATTGVAHQRQCNGAFAGTGLTDQRQYFALVQAEIRTVYDRNVDAFFIARGHAQATYPDDFVHFTSPSRAWIARRSCR
ncbi:hypothetical protein D3C80_830550 [compost metagenome]